MKSILSEMKDIQIVEPLVTIKSVMKENDIENLNKLAEELLKD